MLPTGSLEAIIITIIIIIIICYYLLLFVLMMHGQTNIRFKSIHLSTNHRVVVVVVVVVLRICLDS
jgi:hypothetical protein